MLRIGPGHVGKHLLVESFSRRNPLPAMLCHSAVMLPHGWDAADSWRPISPFEFDGWVWANCGFPVRPTSQNHRLICRCRPHNTSAAFSNRVWCASCRCNSAHLKWWVQSLELSNNIYISRWMSQRCFRSVHLAGNKTVGEVIVNNLFIYVCTYWSFDGLTLSHLNI